MKHICSVLVLLTALAAACAFLPTGLQADTLNNYYTIYAQTAGTPMAEGWREAQCGLNLGTPSKPKASVKAGVSCYFQVSKGSPGPKPVGSY